MVGGSRLFYLITNRVIGESFMFGDMEREYLRKLLFTGENGPGIRFGTLTI